MVSRVHVVLKPRATDVASVTAWLRKYGARAHVTLFLTTKFDSPSITQNEVEACLDALPAGLVHSLAADPKLAIDDVQISMSTVLRLTQLTSLELAKCDGVDLTGNLSSLWQLTTLQHLELDTVGCIGNCRGLAALSRLHHLKLRLGHVGRPFKGFSGSLYPLTALTYLSAAPDHIYTPPSKDLIRCQHLQRLSLLRCLVLERAAPLADVLAALPALPALTSLGMWPLDEVAADAVRWDNVCGLTALQELSLMNCSVQQLPAGLSLLTALTRLSMNREDLPEPERFPVVQQLKELTLCACALSAVPEQISALTALTALHLPCNKDMAGGWQHLRPLTRLRELDLSQIDMYGGMPQEVTTLTALEDLDLGSCNLPAVPEQLSALTALTVLNLSFNEDMAGGWQHLRLLTRLKALRLRSVTLKRGVPSELAALTALEQLNLCSCNLSAVPEQASLLTALTALNLACNYNLSAGWHHLLHLNHLADLDLRGVLLDQRVPTEVAALPSLIRLLY